MTWLSPMTSLSRYVGVVSDMFAEYGIMIDIKVGKIEMRVARNDSSSRLPTKASRCVLKLVAIVFQTCFGEIEVGRQSLHSTLQRASSTGDSFYRRQSRLVLPRGI